MHNLRHLAAMFALLALAGCSTAPIARLGPGGAHPGILATHVAYPNLIDTRPIPTIPYDPSKIEIVDWFEQKERSFGINVRTPYGNGDMIGADSSNYDVTFGQMLRTHNLDGMLNKTVDTERWRLNLFVIRIGMWHTRVGGVGYRFTEPPFESAD